jgi:hypothetical protein
MIVAAFLAFVAAGAAGLPQLGGHNLGNLEGQVGAIFAGFSLVATLIIAAALWAAFTLGMFIGGLTGTVFRKRPAPQATASAPLD